MDREMLIIEAQRALQATPDGDLRLAELELWLSDAPARDATIPISQLVRECRDAFAAAFPARKEELATAIIDQTELRRTLAEAIAWCSPYREIIDREAPFKIVSTAEERDMHLEGVIPDPPGLDGHATRDPDAVTWAILSRREALANAAVSPRVARKGRLLIHCTTRCYVWSLARNLTKGFIDNYDLAPRGAWIGPGPDNDPWLVSWVPDSMTNGLNRLVEEDMPEECLYWADQVVIQPSSRFEVTPWLRELVRIHSG